MGRRKRLFVLCSRIATKKPLSCVMDPLVRYHEELAFELQLAVPLGLFYYWMYGFGIRCHISRIRFFSAHLAMIKIFMKPSIPSAGKMVVTTMTSLDSCMAFEMMCSF